MRMRGVAPFLYPSSHLSSLCAAFATATSGCGQADLASHLLVAQAMSVFSDQRQSKDLLFQACVPPQSPQGVQ